MIQSFGQIFEIIDGDRGKNYPQDKDFSDTGFCLFLSAANVTKNGWKFDNNQFISKEKCEILRKGLVSRGDIVFTTRGTVGNVALYDDTIPYDKVRINSGMIILREKETDTICNKFAYYLLKSKMIGQLITYYCSGSAQPQLPIKDFSKIKVDIPSLSVQKEIASILSNYDTLIDINTKRIKILEETARELYKEWFVRMRFPGHEKTKFVKGIPEGWEYMRIDEYYKTGSGGTPSSSHKEYYDDGSINWVRTGELKDCFIFQSEIKITEQGLKNSSAKMYPRHSVILAMYGNSIGQLGILTQPSSTNQACCVLQPKTTEYSWEFLYLSLMEYRPYLISFGFGAAQQNISQDEIKKFKILFPDNKIVQMFTNIVTSIYGEIETLQLQNQELAATRDRLLPRLLSGELKVGA